MSRSGEARRSTLSRSEVTSPLDRKSRRSSTQSNRPTRRRSTRGRSPSPTSSTDPAPVSSQPPTSGAAVVHPIARTLLRPRVRRVPVAQGDVIRGRSVRPRRPRSASSGRRARRSSAATHGPGRSGNRPRSIAAESRPSGPRPRTGRGTGRGTGLRRGRGGARRRFPVEMEVFGAFLANIALA